MSDRVSNTWWDSAGGFFGHLYLEGDDSFEGFLDSPLGMEERVQQEVSGVISLCNLKKGDSILDCPCGYGRHSTALARMGFSVVGVDINNFFLKLAKQKADQLDLSNCRFEKKDMRSLAYDDEFDAVINMFYSFGFFNSEEENFAVLRNFFSALRAEGKFLMHTHIFLPKVLGSSYKTHEVRRLKSGNRLELFRSYDPKTKRENGQWFILRKDGGRESSTPYSMRVYSKEEFTRLCFKAGFNRVDAYGGWGGEQFTNDSLQLIVVATK
jgi:SAM-dependent methyltransferase